MKYKILYHMLKTVKASLVGGTAGEDEKEVDDTARWRGFAHRTRIKELKKVMTEAAAEAAVLKQIPDNMDDLSVDRTIELMRMAPYSESGLWAKLQTHLITMTTGNLATLPIDQQFFVVALSDDPTMVSEYNKTKENTLLHAAILTDNDKIKSYLHFKDTKNKDGQTPIEMVLSLKKSFPAWSPYFDPIIDLLSQPSCGVCSQVAPVSEEA
jgi:hypothetical protein